MTLPIQVFTMIELSAVITLYASHKAILWGVCIYTLGILLNCLLVLYTISMTPPVKTTSQYIHELNDKGVFLFLYIFSILGIYIYCISYNYNIIMDNNMSESWYYYSYFVTTLMLFNIEVIRRMTTAIVNHAESTSYAFGWMITTFLFAFVYIQYIISMYYQTDGFTI
jgi:hypothetical protein